MVHIRELGTFLPSHGNDTVAGIYQRLAKTPANETPSSHN
jgi:hypothetical protein